MKLFEVLKIKMLEGLKGLYVVIAEVEDEKVRERGVELTDFFQERRVKIEVCFPIALHSFKYLTS